MSLERGRQWFITIPLKAYTDLNEDNLNEWVKDRVQIYTKWAYIVHNHDTNNVHIHLIIIHANPIRFTSLKNKIPYGKIEPLESEKCAIDYFQHLQKPNDPYEKNLIVANYDIDNIIEDIDEKQKEAEELFKDIENATSRWEVLCKHKKLWRDAKTITYLFEMYCSHEQMRVTRLTEKDCVKANFFFENKIKNFKE